MEIHIWNAYACNNSSDFRLVAEFKNAARAEKMAEELTVFFGKHFQDLEKSSRGTILDYADCDSLPLTKAAASFGKKYNYSWESNGPLNVLPDIEVVENQIVLYAGYCHGFGPHLSKTLKNAGAVLVEESTGVPTMLVNFRFPKGKKGKTFSEELRIFFEQRYEGEYVEGWTPSRESDYAWGQGEGAVEDTSFIIEDEQCSYTFPIHPGYLENHIDYLNSKKVLDLTLRIASDEDIIAIQERAEIEEEEALEDGEHTLFDPTDLSFLFTGKLASMTRKEAQSRVEEIAAKVAKSVTKTLDVLVIGDEGSPLFGEGSVGSKQKKAMQLNEAGADIWIISESLFLQLQAS